MNLSSISRRTLLTSSIMISRLAMPSTLHILHHSNMIYAMNKRFMQQYNRYDIHEPVEHGMGYKYNVVQRQSHGFKDYWKGWEALLLSHSDWKFGAFLIYAPCLFLIPVMMHSIYNSVHNDPEVRIRPHKKAWQISQKRIDRVDKYRGGGFGWYPVPFRNVRKRHEYVHKIQNEGINEPGQDGWEELPIPKL